MGGNIRKCGTCKKDAKLYRPYSEFLREGKRVRCKRHVPEKEWDWYVPYIEDDNDGMVWGYISVPMHDIDKWNGFPNVPYPLTVLALILILMLIGALLIS